MVSNFILYVCQISHILQILCSLVLSSHRRRRRNFRWISLRNQRERWSEGLFVRLSDSIRQLRRGVLYLTCQFVVQILVCCDHILSNNFLDFNFFLSKGVLTHNDLLYVVRGHGGVATHLNSMEVFNSATNTQRMLPASMGIGRGYFGTVIINRPF